jgi:hypothetical protein
LRSKSINVNRPVLQRAAGETTRSYDDPSSETGAESLAKKIRAYWSSRGCAVEVHVERIEADDGKRPVYRVVSDLNGGLPRR